MSTLVIDTSDLPLVAYVGDQVVLRRGTDVRHHAETLTPMVAEVLAEAGVDVPDLIVVGTGPAAFTGLRAGIITARTLSTAWNVPLVGVSSLDALAASALDDGQSGLILIDARRREVYAEQATKVGSDIRRDWGPVVEAPANIEVTGPAYGPGQAIYPEIFEGSNVEIDPVAMAELAQVRIAARDRGEDVDLGTEPAYLRRPDIHGA